MKTPLPSKWRDGFPCLPPRWRLNDLRLLGMLAFLFFTVSLLVFETHREVDNLAQEKAVDSVDQPPSGIASQPLEPQRIPGQCTTWPVSAAGDYKPKVHTPNLALQSFAPSHGWKKPGGIAIKALVFYGRKRTVDFLDCYLQQNLAIHGGYLDEIWFMVHTSIEEDLAYLNELVEKRKPQYKIVMPGECQGFDFACMWNPVVEDNTIYVKIDDDIVFIHPDTIPQLVSTRIAEPHPFAVSANLVNSPLTGYKHYDIGAIHPFLPDPRSKPHHRAAQLWRPSDSGYFPNKQIPVINNDSTIDGMTEEAINQHIFAEPGYEGHPWLLVEGVDDPLLKTPMGINKLKLKDDGVGSAYGAAWKSWMISAQQQYSLLRNLELNTMWRYHFGTQIDYPQGINSSADAAVLGFLDPNHLSPGGEQLYDTQYVRYNLNFVALWGHDIRNALPIANDDEQDLTVTKPKSFKRPFVIDTRAVVGHLSFFPQHEGIRRTDLLDRWRAFANEMICTADNQKRPFDQRCPGY
ncbi:putative mitochondrial-processing peptidase subunit alpha protein [Rosellinia necatrix]|uniref:Putative mitochondrial-processing peptidase subunit alpha protein n=1 Tax=Rosellinia necatrix TaxID=77044 RepID=A0A1W2TE21_ROSNE|nr:putative mitochondrial-processing peptidase subunit alpha protein [Rosellinia necatrix]